MRSADGRRGGPALGRLQTQLQRTDYDLAIAAVAMEHNLTVVTRNVRHFDKTGVAILNPFDAA